MNRKAFEQYFSKPEGFFWNSETQKYYCHIEYIFKYPELSINDFNQKYLGWLSAHQVLLENNLDKPLD